MERGFQPLDGGQIQMVVMVVADHDEIDPGEVLEGDPRGTMPPWAHPAQRAGPLGINGIGQDVEAMELKQNGCVVDERSDNLFLGNLLQPELLRKIGELIRPWLGIAMREILKDPEESTFFVRGCRIEEFLSIEVIGLGIAGAGRAAAEAADHREENSRPSD